MARIIGVEVPPNKRIEIALRYIYGIGPTNAKEVLARANIDPNIRAKDLSEAQLSQIVHAIPVATHSATGRKRNDSGARLHADLRWKRRRHGPIALPICYVLRRNHSPVA